MRQDAGPDLLARIVVHEDPVRDFGHRAAAATADVIKRGRADGHARRVRSFIRKPDGILHEKIAAGGERPRAVKVKKL